jgi:cell division protein FtsL
MTPPSTAAARSTGHARTPTRRGLSPRGPRRVSGPSRKAGGAGAARVTRATAAAPRINGGAVALPTPLIHRLGQISESRSLDRLLRSRGWIALLAVLLIGLVFMQVSLLKLNAGMGTDVEKAAALEQSNAQLESDLSKLGSNDRITRLANAAHMVLPTSDNVRYLGADGRRVGGSAAAATPSVGEANTAVLPTVPSDLTGAEGTAGATATVTPPATTTEPQTISSVPGAGTTASSATTATASADTTATSTTTGATAPPTTASTATTGATTPSTTATTAAATGAASVGGATPGG